MAAPSLTPTDTNDVEITTLDSGLVNPGSSGTEDTVRLWNDLAGDGVSTAHRIRLSVRARIEGVGSYVSDGLPLLDLRAWRVRIIGGTAPGAQPTGAAALGAGSVMELPDIPAGTYLELGILVAAPASAPASSYEYLIEANDARTEALQAGLYGAVVHGVLWPAGDGERTELERPADVLPLDPAGAGVTVPDLVYAWSGEWTVELARDETLNQTDGDGATLGAGESYAAAIYLGEGASYVAKGSKIAGVVDESHVPDPTDTSDALLAWVIVDDSGVIEAGDITQIAEASSWHLETLASSLDWTISPGRALVDLAAVRETVEQTGTATASTTETLYLDADGTVTTSPASERPEALWEITTDGTEITSSKDLRSGGREKLVEAVAAAEAVGVAASWGGGESGAQIRPIAVEVELLSLGAGTTSGQWAIDIERHDGTGWASIFDSQGTDDRRPVIAWDATVGAIAEGLPETLDGERPLRAVIDEIPAGDTTGAEVAVRIVLDIA